MSHFTVLVIGDDYEARLAPFNENTEEPEHMEEADITSDIRTEYKYHTEENEGKISFEEFVERWGGCRLEKDDNGDLLVFKMQVKNPKWDWYVMGGRWSDFFLGKDGNRYDQIKVGDIDWKTMELKVIQLAMNNFSNWKTCWKDGERPKSYEELFKESGEDRDMAVARYNAQPVIALYKKLNNSNGFYYGPCPVEAMGFDEEAYIEKCLKGLLVTFALLDEDGVWYERGQMGWFASVSNEMDTDVWNSFVHQKLKSLSPDTLLTLVDCHV